MPTTDDGYGIVNIWDGDRNWILTWERHEVRGPDLGMSPNAWIEFSAGPPVPPERHRHQDPQITGVCTHDRLEFRTVGSVEWDSEWHLLFSQTMDKLRWLAVEVLK